MRDAEEVLLHNTNNHDELSICKIFCGMYWTYHIWFVAATFSAHSQWWIFRTGMHTFWVWAMGIYKINCKAIIKVNNVLAFAQAMPFPFVLTLRFLLVLHFLVFFFFFSFFAHASFARLRAQTTRPEEVKNFIVWLMFYFILRSTKAFLYRNECKTSLRLSHLLRSSHRSIYCIVVRRDECILMQSRASDSTCQYLFTFFYAFLHRTSW